MQERDAKKEMPRKRCKERGARKKEKKKERRKKERKKKEKKPELGSMRLMNQPFPSPYPIDF
jgi:hypothetical protein